MASNPMTLMGVDRWGTPGWYDPYTGKWTGDPASRSKRQRARDKKNKRDAGMGWAALPLHPPLLPLLHPHMQEAAAATTTTWQRAVTGEPVVVDVDKAAEEPADQEPLGQPAEDKEAELDARRSARSTSASETYDGSSRQDAASAAPGTLLSSSSSSSSVEQTRTRGPVCVIPVWCL